MDALWGGYIECIKCFANKMICDDLCRTYQERGLCDALPRYARRLKCEGQLPQSDQGITLRIQLDRCSNQLDNETWCSKLLMDLCRRIEMTPLAGPFTKTLTHPHDPFKSGVSAVLIIQESHIAIHTWPEDNAARIVIDTCGPGLPVGRTAAWLMERVGALSSRVFVSELFEKTIFR